MQSYINKFTVTKSILILLILAQLDGIFTIYGLKAGIYISEANPILQYMISHIDIYYTFALRGLFLIAGAAILLEVYKRQKEVLLKYYPGILFAIVPYIIINIFHIYMLV